MLDFLKNVCMNRSRYRTHSQAAVISCFYNPQNNPYRLLAFQKWYKSIKHLNHRVLECLIGPEARPQLPESPYIQTIRTDSLLWHKESLLNKIVRELPKSIRYVFWVDADVLFTNNDWLVEGVKKLQHCRLIQPFEYCIHLEKNELKPSFNVDAHRATVSLSKQRHPQMWRSFCCAHTMGFSDNKNYDTHGHVGFAWGARREVLEQCPLYDRGLIGGADHIIAHAGAGHIPHPCIDDTFTDNIAEVREWSRKFYDAVEGRLDYVPGDLYHIWHGDLKARQYYRRIHDFTAHSKGLTERDRNGLYVARGSNAYIKRYYKEREATDFEEFDGFSDVEFIADMGYSIFDLIELFGHATYSDPNPEEVPAPDMVPVLPDVPVPEPDGTQPESVPVLPHPTVLPDVPVLPEPTPVPDDIGNFS